MPFIDIATLPQNGNLYDVTANQVVLSQGATLDANSGNPGVFYTPNAGFGAGGSATDSFTYTARDSDGNTLTKTITITVGPPANTAPSISSFSVSCNGFGSTGTSQQFNVIAVTNANPQDEDVPSLTYQWASDSNGSNPVSFPGVPTLPDIDLVNSGVGDTIFTMSKPAGTNLGVNDSSITNSAWLRATDNQGDVSSWVEVQFTLASEQNAPPVVTQGTQPSTGAFAIDQYNQDSVNLGLTVSDPDGNTINLALDSGFGFQDGSGNTLSNAGNVSINGMVVTYEANITGMTQGQVQTVKFQITVADQYGAIPTSNHPIVFTYDVTPVAIINIDRSNVFASSNSIACASTASTNAYLNATQASDITQLQAGDSIYQTANTGAGTVSNPVASSSTSAQWIKIRQTVSGVLQERAVEIDSSGIILSIVQCQISTGNAWPITGYYSDDASVVCYQSNYEVATLWQNVVDTTGAANATMEQVAAAGGTLFTNEVNANAYAGVPISSIPSSAIVPDGFYRTPSETGYYWEMVNGQFVAIDPNTPNIYKNTCPEPIVYQTYSFKAYYNAADRERVDSACTTEEQDLTLATVYFRGDQNDNINTLNDKEKLTYVMSRQLVIYQDEALATQVDYSSLWPTTVFLSAQVDQNGVTQLPPFPGFAIWENDNSSGYTGNYRWFGIDQNGVLEEANILTVQGACGTQFNKPNAWNTFELGGGLASRENVYYAFYSCVAKIENDEIKKLFAILRLYFGLKIKMSKRFRVVQFVCRGCMAFAVF